MHSRQAFVGSNIAGTLNLLEAAAAADVESFAFTSTTSVFGDALVPPVGTPAAWVTEEIKPIFRSGIPIRVRRRIWCLSFRRRPYPLI